MRPGCKGVILSARYKALGSLKGSTWLICPRAGNLQIPCACVPLKVILGCSSLLHYYKVVYLPKGSWTVPSGYRGLMVFICWLPRDLEGEQWWTLLYYPVVTTGFTLLYGLGALPCMGPLAVTLPFKNIRLSLGCFLPSPQSQVYRVSKKSTLFGYVFPESV